MDDPPPPKEKWVLTQDDFDRLLRWLDPDRDRAGERYEEIRGRLVGRFARLGCARPEELANETIDRVAKKLPEVIETYRGERAPYFFSVAYYVHLEYLKLPAVVPLPQTDPPAAGGATFPKFEDDDEEVMDECLKDCMEQLTPRSREMILGYYRGERRVRIRLRKELADRLGIKLPNLRLQAQRVRSALKGCIVECLGRKGLA